MARGGRPLTPDDNLALRELHLDEARSAAYAADWAACALALRRADELCKAADAVRRWRKAAGPLTRTAQGGGAAV
jgi:hypothetical protein